MRGLVLKLREISEYKEFENKHLCCEECGAPAEYAINQKYLYNGNNIKKMDDTEYYCSHCLAHTFRNFADSLEPDESSKI